MAALLLPADGHSHGGGLLLLLLLLLLLYVMEAHATPSGQSPIAHAKGAHLLVKHVLLMGVLHRLRRRQPAHGRRRAALQQVHGHRAPGLGLRHCLRLHLCLHLLLQQLLLLPPVEWRAARALGGRRRPAVVVSPAIGSAAFRLLWPWLPADDLPTLTA
jgi:hypothetical protein